MKKLLKKKFIYEPHHMNFRWRVNFLFLACFFLRLCFTGKYLDSCDSIDFALGLQDYDLSQFQPHFPGYPVYIFISRLFFKVFRDDVWALTMPGVLFGSLTIFPLSLLAKHLFSEKIAILTALFYLLNPLCWLQSERPTSDTMGLFFVIVSACLLCYACTTAHKGCIFWGSLALGFGLGTRISNFPFIAVWAASLFYITTLKVPREKRALSLGLLGLTIGIITWLFPQIGYVGWRPFWQNGFVFSHGHFTDWGGSVITFGGLDRIICLAKSIWAYGLGGWWYDSSVLRLIPSVIMAISLYWFLKYRRVDRRVRFLGAYVLPYLLWVILGQNVANPRHILPIIPLLLMMIAYGLCKAGERDYKGIALILTLSLIMSMAVTSFRLVIKYHQEVPAPIQIIQWIERQGNPLSLRIYCSDEKRFFDYYAPQWDVRKVRDITEVQRDLLSSLDNPQQILLVHSFGEIRQFGITHPPRVTIKGNPYTDSTREGLLLYTLTGL
ncbi:MAG: hypothetical protein AYP45_09140 [Candidatus Brocadia carolinensis]|uniref:Glycosyltransferase RgtA/B/C/D-like domain-containing protein n=1 Tax=Candidatus Brocadia carolinensis TaxID=1004156 RepID=A0A1V4ATM9_9BACT|nr:MAG: hypothetical protein AYP45_09140 [Candidatus Brocadia caroliniensis]